MATPTPLSPTDAKSLIEQIVAQGTVLLTGHCKRDSMPSRGVTFADVIKVLTDGQILRAAEWDDQYQNWKYRVEGCDLDGDDLTAITVIIESDFTVRVLTVF